MSQATLPQPAETDETTEADAPASPPAQARRAWPLVAMAAGLVLLAVAPMVLVRASAGGGRSGVQPAGPSGDATAAPEDALAITLTARDVSVVGQVYAPGEESGWHAHSGIHAVAVLSGVLTVYDERCRPRTFEPGQPYVGGQDLHLVRNEGPVPVVMSVTYVSPSTNSQPTRHLPAPAACGAD